jgi:predicted permease
MRFTLVIRNWIKNVFQRRQVEDDLNDEIRAYLRELTERKIQQGLAPDEARRRALVELGGVDQVSEQMREQRTGFMLDVWSRDIASALRSLQRNPGVTVLAIVSLALGIGANTAVFSVIDPLLVRRLPVRNPEDLVYFTKSDPGSRTPPVYFSYREFEQFREQSRSFSGMFAYLGTPLLMQVGSTYVAGAGESVQTARVSNGFFSTLGVVPVLGRAFAETNDRGNSEPVVVISHDLWRRRFGSDPGVLGRQIIIVRDIPFTIVGVAPPGFSGIDAGLKADMWWPFRVSNLPSDMDGRLPNTPVMMMARLGPGVSLVQARAEANSIYPVMRKDEAIRTGANAAQSRRLLSQQMGIQPGATGLTEELRAQFTKPLLTLMGSVAAVLLIASINVAALLLARATQRNRELAVRLALGSGRLRLIRQLFMESVALGLVAGIGGLAVAHFGTRILLSYAPAQAAVALDTGLDLRVLAFTMGIVLVSVLIFGLAPAFRATKLDINSLLKDGTVTIAGTRSRFTVQKLLVAAQIALSMVLLVGAGLFVRTLHNLRDSDPGFKKQDIVLVQVNSGAVRVAMARQMLPEFEAIAGVESASFFANLGLLGGNTFQSECAIDGYIPRAEDDQTCVLMNVGPGFFETMGTSIVMGRGFRPDDEQSNPNVAVINEAMAKHYFGAQNPLGRRIRGQEIIGVARNTKYNSLRETTPRTFYAPVHATVLIPDLRFVLRTPEGAAGLTNAVRTAVQRITPQFQITKIETMNEVAENTLARERLLVQLSSFFSLFALLLACVGLYGTMSYAVTQRTNEIGIRMALGARVGNLIGMLMRETCQTAGLGISVGFLGTLGATRIISSLLFGLTPTDSVTIAVAVVVLGAAAALAAFLPARRASRVDPMVALRHE